jgi:transposase
MIGIEVIETEESYTSKTDHLALEEMKHHDKYLGKRIKRGLFKTSKNVLLNADVNGSMGIMRKVIGNDFIIKLNIGCVTQPIKVNPL